MQTSAMMNFVWSRDILRQNYFGRIANFDADILNTWPSYYKWKIFSTAVLSLNFDHDLWKINSDIRHRFWTYVSYLMKIGVLLFEKSQRT